MIQPLPIDGLLPEIIHHLRNSRALVLVAEPGAGKTTRVPPAILREGLLSKDNPNLVMLQPRRVAARAAAERIAEENNWQVGREVGYQIRFERRITKDTRLRVMTEGILTRQLLDDPFLPGIGAVILDEFHERSLYTDIAAALLREIRQTVRPDLMLIIMSATLEAEPAAAFLGNCPIVRSQGRTFPVEIEYRAQPLGAKPLPMEQRAADAAEHALDAGDVLIFMPGLEEIRRTIASLEPLAQRQNLLLLPLHGSLAGDEQFDALRPSAQRKIVVATNIAETSLTIPGVRTVIDSGMARIAAYDSRRGMDRLELKRISKASATQRAGRAGRTAPGRCIRLWSQRENTLLEDFEFPEIRRVDLAGTVLSLHSWGADPRTFGWYERPSEETLQSAEDLLIMLGALSSRDRKITEIGRKMVAFPIHPRLSRLMIEAADHGAIENAANIAAVLSEKDLLVGHRGPSTIRAQSDVLIRAAFIDHPTNDIDRQTLWNVKRVRDDLVRMSPSTPRHSKPRTDDTLLKLILSAYPDRVCRRRSSDPSSAVSVGGVGMRLGRESVVHDAEFFVAVEARHDQRSPTRQAIVRLASAIEPQWLEELFPTQVRREQAAIFDEKTQRVVGVSRTWYRDLLLREDRDASVDPQQAASVLADALAPQARAIFSAHESAANLLARVALLRQHMPEHPWPKFDDADLAQVIREAAIGKRSIEEVKRSDLSSALAVHLVYPLDRLLEQHAPTHIQVPSGSNIKIDYSIGQPPVLAVRLQELFGLTDTPRLAAGRAPIVLHLLGPNFRPVQITQDLRSFWQTTYFQVRKDLRAQYPKHSWPEDPLTATPQAKGRHRR